MTIVSAERLSTYEGRHRLALEITSSDGTALAAVLTVALSVPAAHAAADGPSPAAGPKPDDGGGAGPNPVNTGPQFQKHIRGWEPTWQGEWLCHSGQRSGAVCNWEVENDGALSYCDYDVFGNWECYDDLYVARQVDGISGIQVGDSGGPVFRPYWETGTSIQSVMAKGIISGLSGDGRRMVLQDFVTAIDDWKLRDLRPVISPWLPQV
ncbi:hypothetical protein [Microbispora sp. CA-102843]|uniref:hypothetical protein n=1 Tax=Microbispora sp. CA-102843 TaxID=3239952 RepID=UPI003D8A1333